MLNHVVNNCLYYHGFYGEVKDPFATSQQIAINFILVNSILFNNISMIMFLQVPTFLIGIYIQTLGECKIHSENS